MFRFILTIVLLWNVFQVLLEGKKFGSAYPFSPGALPRMLWMLFVSPRVSSDILGPHKLPLNMGIPTNVLGECAFFRG